MKYSRFKNDNRVNSELVLEHMLKEMEKQIYHMTGKDVELVAYERKE
ncbi:MAG: hypothetical protein Q4C46_01425 [Bacillota bacterium]|nr:hypothetical protein [Bacillota bacterium]